MRTAAAIIILVLCTLWGAYKGELLKKRVLLLGELRLMLENYTIAISAYSPTLYELSGQTEGIFGELLKESMTECSDIRQAWSNAAQRLSQLPYCGEESEILRELGKRLGTAPTEGELSLLRLYTAKTDRLCTAAEERYSQKSKLYRTCGALVGLGAAVLII